MSEEKEFCDCKDWEPCGCEGMKDDPHCMYCCKSLSDEQIAEAIEDKRLSESFRG